MSEIVVGTSAWNRLNARTKQHAHKLRQALASALELHASGKWGRAEIEAAGLRDYERTFGHKLSSRHFWRKFEQVLGRDSGRGKFDDLALYLPGLLVRKETPDTFSQYASELPTLHAAVIAVKDVVRPLSGELLLVWDASCSEYQTLLDAGASDGKARRVLVAALAASGLPLALNREALRRNFCRKLDRWLDGGSVPSAIRDLRAANSGRREALSLTPEDRLKILAHAQAGGLSKSWRELSAAGELSNIATQRFIGNPANKSYVPERIREALGPEVKMLRDIHHGPRQAELNGAYITRDWSNVLPGDWYQADDCTLPVYYWQEDENGVPRAMRGQFLLMVDCRTNRALSFALHSERNYNAKVIRGLILRTHDAYGLPRQGFHFEQGIWKSAKLIKGTGDEVPTEETELGLREFCRFMHAKLPRAKVVERILGLLQTKMENQPGYVGRNEMTEKFERIQEKLGMVGTGALHPSKFLLHRDEWVSRLQEICDLYNHEQQQGRLKGLSPREAWEKHFDFQQPLTRLGGGTRYLLANHRRPLKVTANGICVQLGKERHWFRNEATGFLIGRIVQVYFDPDDLSSVFLLRERGDSAALVVPAAPAVPAMSATAEELGAAKASCHAHNRAARTLYAQIKNYFPDNGPSHFRQEVVDSTTAEMGREIAAEKAEIRQEENQRTQTQRKLNSYRRRLGSTPHQDAISPERQLAGYKLLEEAAEDANP